MSRNKITILLTIMNLIVLAVSIYNVFFYDSDFTTAFLWGVNLCFAVYSLLQNIQILTRTTLADKKYGLKPFSIKYKGKYLICDSYEQLANYIKNYNEGEFAYFMSAKECICTKPTSKKRKLFTHDDCCKGEQILGMFIRDQDKSPEKFES